MNYVFLIVINKIAARVKDIKVLGSSYGEKGRTIRR